MTRTEALAEIDAKYDPEIATAQAAIDAAQADLADLLTQRDAARADVTRYFDAVAQLPVIEGVVAAGEPKDNGPKKKPK